MVRRHDPNLALVPHTALGLLTRLHRDPEWGLVELDGVAALFLRARPEHAALIAEARARLAALNRPAEPGEAPLAPRRDPPAILGWLAPRRFPWEAWGRGNGLYGLGLYEAARREYRRALAESGADEIALATNYAAVCYRLGRRDEARICAGASSPRPAQPPRPRAAGRARRAARSLA
jgi:tetratricopeptide (TPR) repeat protein